MHAVIPVPRQLSPLKGVTGNAAEMLRSALANIHLHLADGMVGEEGEIFVLPVGGQPVG